MSITKKARITKSQGEPVKAENLIVNQLTIQNVDRSRKDITAWRNSHQAAENVYYPNRSRLYDLYDDIMLDGHLTGIIGKRVDAVLNKTLHFELNGKRVKEMDDLINSEEFREIQTLILDTKFHGLSGLEFVPGETLQFEEINRKHIKIEKGVIAIEQSELTGTEYKDNSNIWVIGKKRDYGILLKCAPYALWKRGDMADWAQYVEIFGQPVRVMKYDAYDLKTKMELKQIVDESGSSLAILIPKQVDFEMKDGKQSNGDGALQEKLKNACNQEMSVIVLGNTESTTSSSSSGHAQSKEHSKQQLEVTKSDLKYVVNKLNSPKFLRILQSYGYKVEGGRFTYEKEIDLAHLKTRLEIDKEVSTKVPISDDYWYETYGIPKPDNYNELKAKMEEAKTVISANLKGEKKEDPEDEPEDTPTNKNKGKDKQEKNLSDDETTTLKQFLHQCKEQIRNVLAGEKKESSKSPIRMFLSYFFGNAPKR